MIIFIIISFLIRTRYISELFIYYPNHIAMLKYLLPLFTLCYSLAFGQEVGKSEQKQEGVQFFEGSLSQAIELAQKSKRGPKLIFVDCYTTWCGPCAVIANEVFPLKRVGDFLNQNFINLKIDMEKGDGVLIAQKYKIRAFPTFLILDQNGEEVNRVIGGGNADKFIEKIKAAMLPANSVGVLRYNYTQEPTFENALLYLKGLNSSRFLEEMDHFLIDLSNKVEAKRFYSEAVWPYIKAVIANPESQLFNLIIEKKGAVDQFLTKERVDRELASALKDFVRSYVHKKLEKPDSLSQEQFNSSVLSKVALLPILSWGDLSTYYYVKIAQLYAKGEANKIASLLNVEEFMQLNKSDRTVLEWIIGRVESVTQEQMNSYYLQKEQALKKELKINSHFIEEAHLDIQK